MAHYRYMTKGTCAQAIDFDLEGDEVKNIVFYGGCNGNLKAISKLLDGAKVDYVIETLAGNRCGMKSTSCADQLTIGIKKAFDGELDPIS